MRRQEEIRDEGLGTTRTQVPVLTTPTLIGGSGFSSEEIISILKNREQEIISILKNREHIFYRGDEFLMAQRFKLRKVKKMSVEEIISRLEKIKSLFYGEDFDEYDVLDEIEYLIRDLKREVNK